VTILIALLASIVAITSAVRSTWSPCGLSMLSSITPITERAKGNSYRSTATWFVIGGALGGATLGVMMAALAVATRSVHLSSSALGLIALGAALVAAGSDAGVRVLKLPVHRRQVNERWLDQYRAWVYGAGFGWQIGTGLATYITTAAVYLMILLAALTTVPLVALVLGTFFGLLRGLAVVLTRRLTDASALRAFHRRFTAAGPRVDRAVIGVEIGAAIVLVASLRSAAALAIAAGAAASVAVAWLMARRKVAPDPDSTVQSVSEGPGPAVVEWTGAGASDPIPSVGSTCSVVHDSTPDREASVLAAPSI
jgi:hypothetical protein